MKTESQIGVLGTGAWGLALSSAISKKNNVNLFFVSRKDFKKVSEKQQITENYQTRRYNDP